MVDNRGLGTIVVRNLKYARLDADAGPEVFTHYKGRPLFGVTVALRIEGDALPAAPTITKALGASRSIPISRKEPSNGVYAVCSS